MITDSEELRNAGEEVILSRAQLVQLIATERVHYANSQTDRKRRVKNPKNNIQ